MPTADEAVVVVGAGAAGLSSAAALTERGVDALVLERDEQIGGTWARRYDRLHLHTIRRFSGLAHHPIPSEYPRYLSKDDYARYLASYAERFRLRVSLDEPVVAVRSGDGDSGGWLVDTTRRSVLARVVIVATGHYAEPRLPSWEGVDVFSGRLIHSADYRSGSAFQAHRVLVVGLGNTGAEIAADLVERGATSVSVAVRTPPPIIPRELLGVVPVQLVGVALMPLRIPRVVDRAGAAFRRLGVGDLRRYGIGKAEWEPFTARRPGVIDVGFLKVLKAGRVNVRPALVRFHEDGVEYKDGSREEVDTVIAATGFTTGLERIIRVAGVLREDGMPNGSRAGALPPGLHFVGFDETVRGQLFEARRESIKLARRVARFLEQAPDGTSSV